MPVKRARLSKRVAKLVGAERVCRVATVGEAGMPQLVPVCHTLVGDRIYFGSGDDARKVLNLEHNPASPSPSISIPRTGRRSRA